MTPQPTFDSPPNKRSSAATIAAFRICRKQLLSFCFLLILLCCSHEAFSQTDLWWTGATNNNWTEGTNWSTTDPAVSVTTATSAPNGSVDVHFSDGSFPNAQDYTITFDNASNCRNLLIESTGTATKVNFNGGAALAVFEGIVIEVDTVGILSFGKTGSINLSATNAGHIIDFNHHVIYSSLAFDGVGGEWQFASALTANTTVSLRNGFIDFNGLDHAIHTITLSGQGATSKVDLGVGATFTTTNLTTSGTFDSFIGDKPNFTSTDPASTSITLTFTHTATNTPVVNVGTVFGRGIILSGRTDINIGNFDLIEAQQTIAFGSNALIDADKGSIPYNGALAVFARNQHARFNFDELEIRDQSLAIEDDCDITPTTFSVSGSGGIDINWRSNAHPPPAQLLYASLLRADLMVEGVIADPAIVVIDGVNGGSVRGAAFEVSYLNDPSRDLYWIGNTADWNEPSNWSFTSGGTPLSGTLDRANGIYECPPRPQDDVFFDANSFDADGQMVTINESLAFCRDMTWQGLDQVEIDWTGTENIQIHGNLVLDKNMVEDISYNRIMTFYSSNGTIDFQSGTDNRNMSNARFAGAASSKYTQLSDEVYINTMVPFNHYIIGANNDLRLVSQMAGITTLDMTDAEIYSEGAIVTQLYLNVTTVKNNIFNEQSHWYATAPTGTISVELRGGATGAASPMKFPNFTQTSPDATLAVVARQTFDVTGDATFFGNANLGHTEIREFSPGVGGNLVLSGTNKTITMGTTSGNVSPTITAEGLVMDAPTCEEGNTLTTSANAPTTILFIDGNNIDAQWARFETVNFVGPGGDVNNPDPILDLRPEDVFNLNEGGNLNLLLRGGDNGTPDIWYWRPRPIEAGEDATSLDPDGDGFIYTGVVTDPRHWTLDATDNIGQTVTCEEPGFIPTSIDDVVFDNASGDGTEVTITSTNWEINNMTWEKDAPNAILDNMRFLMGTLRLNGSMLLAPNLDIASVSTITFQGAGVIDVDLQNLHIPLVRNSRMIFNNENGEFHFLSPFTMGGSPQLTAGELITNGHDFTAHGFIVPSNANHRLLDIQNSNILLTSTIFGRNNNVWSAAGLGDVEASLLAEGSSITFTIGTGIFTGGDGVEYDEVNFEPANPSSRATFASNSTIKSLTSKGAANFTSDLTVGFLNLVTDQNHSFTAGKTTTFLPEGNIQKNGDLSRFLNINSTSTTAFHDFVKPEGGNIYVCNLNVLRVKASGKTFKTNAPVGAGGSTYAGVHTNTAANTAALADNPDNSWDFTAIPGPADFEFTEPEPHYNVGDYAEIPYLIDQNDTGPFQIHMTAPNGDAVVQDINAQGTTTMDSIGFFVTQTGDAVVDSILFFECPGFFEPGNVVAGTSALKVPSLLGKSLAADGDTEDYLMKNLQNYVYIMNGGDRSDAAGFESRLPQVAVQDGLSDSDTSNLEMITVTTTIDATELMGSTGDVFLKRHWTTTQTGDDGDAHVRFFLTQAELTSLKTATNNTDSDSDFLSSLIIHKFPSGGNPTTATSLKQLKLSTGVATEIGATTYVYEAEVCGFAGNYYLGTIMDADGDGIANEDDIDDDNDGILDSVEDCVSPLATFPTPTNQQQSAAPPGWTIFANNGSTDIDDGDSTSVISNGALFFNQSISSLFPGSTVSDYWMTGAYTPGNPGFLAPKFEANYTTLTNLIVGKEYQVVFDGTFQDLTVGTAWGSYGAYYLYLDYTSAGTAPQEADKTAPITINSQAKTITLKFTATQTSHDVLLAYYAVNAAGNITNNDIRMAVWFESFKIISTESLDIDNDGIVNRLDLDSDGDGCYDSFEASVTSATITGMPTDSIAAGPYGDNGFASTLESDDTGAATVNYTPTYSNAIDSLTADCIDSDMDGIVDGMDIDDDNDGILDTEECENFVAPSTFTVASGVTETFTMSAANSFTFDLYYLDNSFNFEINGTKLAPTEMQFHNGSFATGQSKIGFSADNVMYGTSGVSNIYDMNKTAFSYNWDGVENPLVRVSIDNSGAVTLMGKRTETSSFEPMTVISGDPLNTVTWNTNSSNTVIISQLVSGPTTLSGYGYGIGDCPDTDMDGIANHLDLDSDGDGCYDSFEAGVTGATITGMATDSIAAGPYGNNGFASTLESSDSLTAMANYTSTYAMAIDSISSCPIDTDGDGVTDNIDLDDDNDGILDVIESLAPLVNFNSTANGNTIPWDGTTTANVTVSTTANFTGTASSSSFTTPYGESASYSSANRLDFSGDVSFTFTFDTPVPANEIAFQILDVNDLGSPIFNIAITGGASTNDFELVQSDNFTALSFNESIGQISRSTGTDRQHGILVGKSANLVSSLQITSSNVADFVAYNLLSIHRGTLDTDNDGIANHLDLDSDGDGCYDSYEAGVIGVTNDGSTTDSLAVVTMDTTGVGANGFANTLETNGDGIYTATYNYSVAINAAQNQCEDNDMDGVPDFADIDDDNDGILDCDESISEFITGLTGSLTDGNNYTVTTSANLTAPNATIDFLSSGDIGITHTTTGNYTITITLDNPTTVEITPSDINHGQIWNGIVNGHEPTRFITNGSDWILNQGTVALNSIVQNGQIIEGNPADNWVDGNADWGTISSNNVTEFSFRTTNSEGIKILLKSFIDTDNDGIANYLDLDSDGDGCYDSYEAGVIGATNTGMPTDSTVAGPYGVNGFANTLENNDTETATANYTPTYAMVIDGISSCSPDSDGDGVTDNIDLDDDNDGILDIDELGAIVYDCTTWSNATTGTLTVDSTTINVAVSSTGDMEAATIKTMPGVCNSVIQSNQENGDTITFDFSTPINNPIFAVLSMGHANYPVSLVFTDQAGNPINIERLDNETIAGTGTTYTISGNVLTPTGYVAGEIILKQGTYSQINIAYNFIPSTATPPTDRVWLSLYAGAHELLDTDNDGIANHLDLDSDNDGCYDSYEAGVIGATNNGSPTDSLAVVTTDTTGVGANGFANTLETTTIGEYDGTYTYANAIDGNSWCKDNDGDDVPDFADLDDDNDGILDTEECTAQTLSITNLTGTGLVRNFEVTDSTGAIVANGVFETTTTGSLFGASISGDDLKTGTSASGNAPYNYIIRLTPTGGMIPPGSMTFTNDQSSIPSGGYNNFSAFTVGGLNLERAVLSLEENNIIDGADVGDALVLGSTYTNDSSNDRIAASSNNFAITFSWGLVTSSVEMYVRKLDAGVIDGSFAGEWHSFSIEAYSGIDCFTDTDGDGIVNSLDLDSDNDGCFDSYEAGVIGATNDGSATDSLAIVTTDTTGVGANGFANTLESNDTETAIANYTPTYAMAIDSINNCSPDSDGDGIADNIDLDDDNDGILDSEELICALVEDFENPTNPGTDSNVNGFEDAFPIGTSSISNSHNSAGYMKTGASGSTTSFTLLEPLEDGVVGDVDGYSGLHSAFSGSGQEVIMIELAPSEVIQAGVNLQFTLDAYVVVTPTWVLDDVGYIEIFGIVEGQSPSLNATNQDNRAALLAVNGVDFLGRSELVDNTAQWESFAIDAIPTNNYDRLLIIVTNDEILNTGATRPTDGTYLGFDNLKYTAERDTDGDGVYNHLDLDSDGDGCYDSYEAGVIGATNNGSATDSLAIVTTDTTGVGANGFANVLETTTLGEYDGTYTYVAAIDSLIATCHNSTPLAIDDINTTQLNEPVTGNVLTNDIDLEGDTLIVNTTPMNVMGGTVTIDSLGNYTFIPTAGQTGEGSFEYEVCDTGMPQLCDTAKVVISIIDNTSISNNPPLGVEDNLVMENGEILTASLLSNDSDPDGDSLIINTTPVSLPSVGTLVINTDGTFEYTPPTDYVGDVVFEYEVCDDGTPVACDTVEVMISVLEENGMNDVYATDDAATTMENTPVIVDVLANDNDPEDGMLTATIVDAPANGTLTQNVDGTYSYEPNDGYMGNDQFTYSVCDDGTPVACDTATVAITVLDRQEPPYVIPTPLTIPVDSIGEVCMTIQDWNTGDTFTAMTCAGSPMNGTAMPTVNGTELCLEYTPDAGFAGTDEICIIVCDQTGRCDTTSIPVTVVEPLPVGTVVEPPVVIVTPITVIEGETTEVCTVVLDPNAGDTFTTQSCGGPDNGVATPTVSGSELCIEYTPTINYSGADEICLIVCDQTGLCDTVDVPVTVVPKVLPVDSTQAPVVIVPPVVVPEDSTVTVCAPIADANPMDTHTVMTCGGPENGTVTTSINNTTDQVCVTYDPDPHFTGTDSICIIVCDNTGLCDTATIPIEVYKINDGPIAVDDIATTQLNVPVSGNVLDNDEDIDGDSLMLNTTPMNVIGGMVTISPNGDYTFTPTPGYTGTASFEYEICDPGNPVLCDTAMVSIQVIDNTSLTNNPPSGGDDNLVMEHGDVLTADLLSNDSDPDGDSLFINTTPVSLPSVGTLIINTDGTFAYAPPADYVGDVRFEYEVCDDGTPVACDIVEVMISVLEENGMNDVYATDDAATTMENTPVIVDVLANDNDPEDGILTATIVDGPTNGTLTQNADGTYSYEPTDGYTGNDQFTYSVCDDGTPVACDTATVSVTVLDRQEPPYVIPTPLTIPVDSIGEVCMTIQDWNTGDTFTAMTCAGSPMNGTATPTVNGTELCMEYTPDPSFAGTDEICIIVCDQTGRCDTTSVPVTVVEPLPVGTVVEPPVVIVTPITVVEGETTEVCTVILDPNAGDTFTTQSCGGPDNGIATPTVNGSELCIEYTPTANYSGDDEICLIVCDQTGLCDTVDVPVTVVPKVLPVDSTQAPVVIVPPVVVPEDSTVTVCAPIADANPADTHTVMTCGGPENGTATVAIANGEVCITYDPDPHFTGTDKVCIIVCDNTGLCDTTAFPIEVLKINDGPIAVDDIATTQLNIPVSGNVLDNDEDIDGDSLAINTTPINPIGGTAVIDSEGNYTFTPTPGFIGTASFQYEVCDPGNPVLCDTAMVSIEVVDNTSLTNNGPIGGDDNLVMENGDVLTADLLSNDSDPDGDSLFINTTPITDPPVGTLIINPDGTFAYAPPVDYVGDVRFEYEVCDDGMPMACDTVEVMISVLEDDGENSLYATDDAATTMENEPVIVDVLANDNDPEDGTLTATIVDAPTNGTLTQNADGTYRYEPNYGYMGNDQFTYSVCNDGTPVACDTATVVLTVLDRQEPPYVIPTPLTIPVDSIGEVCMTIQDWNTGDTFTAMTCAGSPMNGTATPTVNGTELCMEYTPDPSFAGTDEICIIVCDQTGRCDTTSVPVTVVEALPVGTVEEPPVVIVTPITVIEGETTEVCTVVLDPNAGDTFTTQSCGGPDNGIATPTVSANELCIEYTPSTGYTGDDEICLIVCDQTGLCDTIDVPVTVVPKVLPVDSTQAPVVIVPPVVVPEDSTVTVCAPIADANPEDTHTVMTCGGPENGTASVAIANGEVCITYEPIADFNGRDEVCIIVCDQTGLCDTLNIPIVVTPVNDPPIAEMDTLTLDEDMIINIMVQSNDSDLDMDELTTRIITGPINGTTTLTGMSSIDYTPNPNYNGVDSITYEICDDGAPQLCDTTTVSLMVNPVNDPPTLIDDINVTNVDMPVDGNVLTNDTDVDNDFLYVNTTPINVMNGNVTIDSAGNYTFTPDPGFFGEGSFQIEICDDGSPVLCDTSTVVIEVIDNTNTDNNMPTGMEDNFTMEEGTPLTSNLLANDSDPDGDVLTISTTPVTAPTSGMLTIYPDGTFEFTPNTGFVGDVAFEYEVCDNGTPQACDTVAVIVEVLVNDNENDLYATDDVVIGSQNETQSGNVTDNDYDPEGDKLTVTLVDDVENGTLILNSDGSYFFVPDHDYIGNDQFTVSICDDRMPMACDTTTAYLTVLPIHIFDLALTVRLAPTQQSTVFPGTDVVYQITLYNQGNIDASDIHIVDYIPSDLTFNPAANTAARTGNNKDWIIDNGLSSTASSNSRSSGDSETNLPTYTIDSLAAQDSININIVLNINVATQATTILNITEISCASNPLRGSSVMDIDSNADADKTNDVFQEDDFSGVIISLFTSDDIIIIGDTTIATIDTVVTDVDPESTPGVKEDIEEEEVVDCSQLPAYCYHGLAIELMPIGMVEIKASDISVNDFSQCPDYQLGIWHESMPMKQPTTLAEVRSLPTNLVFTCQTLGNQDVQLYITDPEGNWNFCATYINVQDNNMACIESQATDPTNALLGGQVNTWKGEAVQEVLLNTTQADYMTTQDGFYHFELPMEEAYTVTPQKNHVPLNGVSTFDLVLMTKHILGIQPFDNPYQWIAADVNQSKTITAFDLVQLRKMILAIDTEFTNNTSWRFVDEEYTFSSDNPLTEYFPEQAHVSNLTSNMVMDFVAVKIGDINGNVRPNALHQSTSRNSDKVFEIQVTDQFLKAGQTYKIDLQAKSISKIQGYQFTLNTKNVAIEQIQNALMTTENFGLNNLEAGTITVSWNKQPNYLVNEEELFTIQLQATKDIRLSEVLQLNNQPTVAEAYDLEDNIMEVQLKFIDSDDNRAFDLAQNKPNPFRNQTSIAYTLPGNSPVELILRNEAGKVIKVLKQDGKAGYNQFELNELDLAPGFIYYQLTTKFGTKSKKMIRVE